MTKLTSTAVSKLSSPADADRFYIVDYSALRSQYINFSDLADAVLASGEQPEYTVTNDTEDRTFNADDTTLAEVADILSTLIADLQTEGLLS